MDERKLDTDMGDDEQEDEVRAYERYIEDPPSNLVIRETGEQGSLGISEALQREWTRHGQAVEDAAEDERPAEEAAIQIEEEPQE